MTLSANEPRRFEPADLRLEKEKGGGTSQVLSKRIERQADTEQTRKSTLDDNAKTARDDLVGSTEGRGKSYGKSRGTNRRH